MHFFICLIVTITAMINYYYVIFFINICIFLLTYYDLETLFDELAFSCGWGYEVWNCDSGVMVGKKWLRTHCCSAYNSEYFTLCACSVLDS